MFIICQSLSKIVDNTHNITSNGKWVGKREMGYKKKEVSHFPKRKVFCKIVFFVRLFNETKRCAT